jgi:hypothetical protein
MTDPVDQETSTVERAPARRVAEPSIVAWDDVPPTGNEATSPGRRRVQDLAVSVAALLALLILSLFRAGREVDLESSERMAYVVGVIAFGLLVSTAARWLWLRARRRADPTAHLLSPWIPIGAVILVVFSIFGSARS